MIVALLDQAVRIIALAGVAFAGLVAATQWAVRARRLNAFGGWARLMRRTGDPLLKPIERRLVRAGGNPQSAPWWLLGAALAGGLLLIAAVDWAIGFVLSLIALAGGGPRIWLATLVGWSIGLVMAALFVRAIASWFGLSPYSKWMRVVMALTDWIVDPIRRILPPTGPVDFSPLVAYLALYVARRLILGALF